MATYTTTTRINDLTKQSGSALHNKFDADAITNAVAFANDYLEQLGMPTSSITEGMKTAADMYALAYLADGLILQMAVRGDEEPSINAIQNYAEKTREAAEKIATAYITHSLPYPKLVQNENWNIWPRNARVR